MDLTPQVINEVEFSMARRGYDPDQVDEFLEKVAVAVGGMNERIAQLHERVVVAERRAAEAEQRAVARPERVVGAPEEQGVSAAAEAELETLKRTLILAQKTADEAVRQAEAEARKVIAEAEAQARAAHEATHRAVLEEIAGLEQSRGALRADVEGLERQLAGQRSRLQAVIADLQRILEEPAAVQAPTTVNGAAEVPAEEPAAPEPSSLVAAEDVADDDEAWARFSADAAADVDAGPPTEPVLRLDRLEPADDDAYLSELRKAMLDDTGAPEGEAGFFDDDVARAARTGRFGRRR